MIGRLMAWTRTEEGRKRFRYVLASAASVLVGQIVLALAFGVVGWTARTSNVVSFSVAGALSYWLHRQWTWGKRGRSHVLREVFPFWAIAAAGLLVSTWAVGVAESAAADLTDMRVIQTAMVMGASLAAYGSLWVLKFVIFDRYLFGARPARGPAEDPQTQGSPG